MTASTSTADAIAIYAHFPWCVAKCPYCDFNSHSLRGDLQEDAYVDALVQDMQQEVEWTANRSVHSVFLGGGTPSLFSPAAIERFIGVLQENFALASDAEVTLEANPGALERGSFAGFKAAGVTRLSIGAQSFSNQKLQALGRIHDSAAIGLAAHEAHDAGLHNFNIDLMYGLPEQSVAQALSDVEQALALGPAHVSHYHLTLEPNTVFHHSPPDNLPDDELSWEIFTACQDTLGAAGFKRYEVSAYARPGLECQHNLQYWRYGDYLGLGAGAHGKITLPGGEIRRYAKSAHPREYMRAAGSSARFASLEQVSTADAVFEFMLNATRLKEGFSDALFRARTGLNIHTINHLLDQASDQGLLLQPAPEHWAPSDKGFRFLDDLQQLFLPDDSGNVSLLKN